jgi:hypothetical protein
MLPCSFIFLLFKLNLMLSVPEFFIGVDGFAQVEDSGLCLGQLFLETSYLINGGGFGYWEGFRGSWCLIDESIEWGFTLFFVELGVRVGRDPLDRRFLVNTFSGVWGVL